MSKLLYSQNPIDRTERLVDLLDIRKDWNAGNFDGCAYEHMLPVFESLFRHLIKPFNRPGEQAERARLERAIHEVFGKTTRGFSYAPPHRVMMRLMANYASLGRTLEYPITEWSKDELFKEYETASYWHQVWSIVGTAGTIAETGKIAVDTAAKIRAAATVLRVTGALGHIITFAGIASTAMATYYFSRELGKISEEVQNRIEASELTKQEWDKYDLEIRRRYD